MLTTTLNYFLCFLLSLLTTVTAQTLLKLSVPDHYGTATIRFQQKELIKFYNCLCHSETQKCSVYANTKDNVYSQHQRKGIEVNFYQYECSKLLGRNDFKCSRLYFQTDSCRQTEYCLTFYISPNETECNFAGSIGIVWTNPGAVYYYNKEVLSINQCLNGCNGNTITTPSPAAITSTQTDETQTFIKTSTLSVNVSEPDSMSNLTGATPKSRLDQGDDQTKLILGIVVGVFLFVIISVLILGFIISKKRRTSSTSHETYFKYQTSTIMAPSTPDNNGLRSLQRINSGQHSTTNCIASHSTLNTTHNADVSKPLNNTEASDTYANHCYREDKATLKDSIDLQPFEQVEYYNINGQVKNNQQPSTIENDSVEYFNTCCNSEDNDPPCHEDFHGTDLGNYEDGPDGDLGNYEDGPDGDLGNYEDVHVTDLGNYEDGPGGDLGNYEDVPGGDLGNYEDVPDRDLGNLKDMIQMAGTNHTEVDGVETKSNINNSTDGNKAGSYDDIKLKPHVYTAVNKVKENSAQDYSTLNATVRKVTNPYNLLLDPNEYANTNHNDSGTANGQREMYFELEEGEDCYPDREDRVSSITDQCKESEVENVYEDDPQVQGIDNTYSQIDSNK